MLWVKSVFELLPFDPLGNIFFYQKHFLNFFSKTYFETICMTYIWLLWIFVYPFALRKLHATKVIYGGLCKIFYSVFLFLTTHPTSLKIIYFLQMNKVIPSMQHNYCSVWKRICFENQINYAGKIITVSSYFFF